MRAILRSAVLGLLLAAASITMSAQAADPVGLGTWKLNVEKSKFNPGPPPKSATITFEAVGKGVKVTSKTVGADGKLTETEYTSNYDGKDVPLKGSATIDTVNLRRVNAHTTDRTDKKDGKVVQTIHRVVAKDGKTFTATIKGTNAKGEKYQNVLHYEKA